MGHQTPIVVEAYRHGSTYRPRAHHVSSCPVFKVGEKDPCGRGEEEFGCEAKAGGCACDEDHFLGEKFRVDMTKIG